MGGGGTGKSIIYNYTLYFHKVHTQIPTQSRQRLNSHLLLNGIYGGMCCKLDFANKLAIFTVIPKDNRHVAIEQIFMLILKNYFVLLYAA